MRVAMYYSNNDVRIEELAVPEISAGELLVRIYACGICGSDVMQWYRAAHTPLVLGHEIAGEIVAIGEGIRQYKEGDRISASHHVPCNHCRYCLSGHHTVCETMRQTKFDPGGFSEYVRLPAINVKRGVYLLPKSVSFAEATFIEPLACVLRGQRLAHIKKDDSVLIIGSGISGLLHVQMARYNGAACIIATDIIDYRLKAAQKFGVDSVIHAQDDVVKRFREVNDGRKADLVIICTTALDAYTQALESVDRGGTVLFFAATDKDVNIPFSVNDLFWRNEITLTSSYAASPQDHMEALELISTGKIQLSQMITHRLNLRDTGQGFKLVTNARESLKIIIEPQR